MSLLMLVKTENTTENSIKLYPHQIQVKKQLYDAIKNSNKRIMCVAPCGWGKTILIASVVHDAVVTKGKKTLIVTPFSCLVSQTIKAFLKHGIECGVIAGGYPENRDCKVQVATVQTLGLNRDISWFNYDICILDECHILSHSSWSKQQFPLLKDGKQIHSISDISNELRTLEFDVDSLGIFNSLPEFNQVKQAYRNLAQANHPDRGGDKEVMQRINNAWEVIKKHEDLFGGDRAKDDRIVIGLTATPWRLSKRESMGDIFEEQVLGLSPEEMVQAGYLVPCIFYGIRGADLKGVRTVAGDFDLGQLEVKCADTEVIQSAVDNYQRLCSDRLFICFTCTIHHAQLMVAAFNKREIKTAIITGDTPNKEREIIFEKVRSRKLQGIVSVNAISIGFDLPEISAIVHCRPTKSKSLYIQGLGRGMRIAPWIGKKNCIVLDQAGNTKRFGLIEDIAYGHLRRADDSGKQTMPTKDCPQCEAIVRVVEKKCPQCGYEFPIKEKPKPVGDMQLILSPRQKPIYDFYRKHLSYAFNSGYSPFWAIMKTREKFSLQNWFPPREWGLNAVFRPIQDQILLENNKCRYLRYLQKIAKKHNNPDWWIETNMKREFG